MSRGTLLAALAAALAAAAGPAWAADYAPGRPLETVAGARADFTFRCRGCHGFAGEGTPGHVPRLDGFVGLYTHLPDGRDYLMRVPGVARAKLDDARLAAVLNWMLATYGAGQVAPGFAAFTAAEVREARRRRLPELADSRARLVRQLQARGLVPPGEDGLRAPGEAASGAR